jgi:hypothetical protein
MLLLLAVNYPMICGISLQQVYASCIPYVVLALTLLRAQIHCSVFSSALKLRCPLVLLLRECAENFSGVLANSLRRRKSNVSSHRPFTFTAFCDSF